MLELSNVSTIRLTAFLKYARLNNPEMSSLYLNLTKNGVKDYQTLKNLIESGKKEFNNDFFINALKEIEENILYGNEVGKEIIMFPSNNYKDTNLDKKTISTTDRKTSCDVLLYKSPAIVSKGKAGILKDIQISEAKDLLGKVIADTKATTGHNAFVEAYTRFGNIDADKIRKAINFYEEQVIRQSLETQKKGINLFILNQREKRELVRNDIKKIVKYLVDNADNCIWGEFTPAQKTRLMTAVTSYAGYDNQILKQRIVEVITNYTTLTELKEGVDKQKTLDRFIIK